MANSPIPAMPQPSNPDNDVIDNLGKHRAEGGGGGEGSDQHVNPCAKGVSASPSKPSTPRFDAGNRVNVGDDDEMEVIGYVPSKPRMLLALLAVVFSAGLVALVFYWKKEWLLRFTHTRSPVSQAKRVLLADSWGRFFVQKVLLVKKDGTSVTKREEKIYYSDGLQCDSETHLMSGVDSSVSRSTSGGAHSNRPGSGGSSGSDSSQKGNGSPARLNNAVHRFFVHKKIKYMWSSEHQRFCKLYGLEKDVFVRSMHQFQGLTEVEATLKRILYGSNKIVIRVTPLLSLLFTEALNPFYIFQIFSMALWYADEYEFYASCILVISLISLTVEVWAIRSMQKRLRERVNVVGTVRVCRGANSSGELTFSEIAFDDLVPGDVLEIPKQGCQILVDAVLISGNCIVNEAMLTGESAPVTKTPLPTTNGVCYSIQDHSRHTLFCGTEVVQTRFYGNQKVLAVVVRTGFSTSKGELVRSILYPKPVDHKFNKDAGAFLLFLAGIAMIGFVYTIVVMARRGYGVGKILLRSLDLVTIVVPPALPAAMTVGIIHAQSRLKRSNIFCISPKLINVCGSLNTVCFDKTGTLTEDGLDLRSVHPVDGLPSSRIFLSSVHASRDGVIDLADDSPILAAMATCHSLTVIDSKLVGDPLDIRMFEGTGWSLDEPEIEDTAKFDVMMPTVVRSQSEASEIGILRQFPFSSSLQRMSVITKVITRDGPKQGFHLYCKGSPEMIVSLSESSSVPSNFQDVLTEYTQQGFRVLALAHRPLAKLSYVKAQRVQREALEANLTFLGLLILENRLKPASLPSIVALKEALIRPVMVTGDNMLTALSVARECGMVDKHEECLIVNAFKAPDGSLEIEYLSGASPDESMALRMANSTVSDVDAMESGLARMPSRKFHFALSGKTFTLIRQLKPELLKRLVVRGTIFARMSPDHKQHLVEELQALGYYVGMCGDGANDCGALRTAHAGVSLSDTEASIASPFTSKVADISCVPIVIREGRAALVTSFGIFKYMAAYSLIQFVSVLILYWFENNLTDWEFLYIDLYLLTVLSIFYGHTPAYSSLAPKPPTSSLLSVKPVLSLLAQVSIATGFQTYVFLDVKRQPWFTPFIPNHEVDYYWSYENSAVFYVSVFQYITAAIAFSKGAPYRKTIFSNYLFLIALLVLTGTSIWVLLYPPLWLAHRMELRIFPEFNYGLKIFGLVVLNFLIALLVEMLLVDSNIWMLLCKRDEEDCVPTRFSANKQHQYRSIEKQIQEEPSWPPISRSSTHTDFAIITSDDPSPSRGGDGGPRRSSARRLQSEMSVGSDAFSDLGSSPGSSPPASVVLEKGVFFNEGFTEVNTESNIRSKDDSFRFANPSVGGVATPASHSLPTSPAIRLGVGAVEPVPHQPSLIDIEDNPGQTSLAPRIQVILPTPTHGDSGIHDSIPPPPALPPALPAPPSFSPRRSSNVSTPGLATSIPPSPAVDSAPSPPLTPIPLAPSTGPKDLLD